MSKKLVFLSLVMSGLWACGSGSKDMTAAEFTQEVSKAECDSVAPACRIPQTDCLSTRQAVWSDVVSTAMAQGRPFDAHQAEECVSKTKNVYGALKSNLAISAQKYREQKLACDRVFHGPAKENEPCTTDIDCVDTLVCDKGFCGKAVEVAAGEQCANIGQYCSLGYTCASIGDSGRVWRCVARANKGAVCTSDATCLEALRCLGGACADGLPDASPCQADEECNSGFCEPFAHECGADIRFASGSTSCKPFQPVGPVPTSGGDAGAGAD